MLKIDFLFNKTTTTKSLLFYYTKIKEWNKGYLVVMAKYSNSKEPEEEYIDLAPILQNLYFDVDEVMSQIREVKIVNNA